ncbi:hypothetical protein DKX38_014991 [Salix brachista]|uniref:Uncharacterized protein n=1 Tax=Salix brachista TaxID=2182728 RepID=A0A5N5L4P3_9ROSI|nr:hypothetical protein DKX38_014991 [Salix brachista]
MNMCKEHIRISPSLAENHKILKIDTMVIFALGIFEDKDGCPFLKVTAANFLDAAIIWYHLHEYSKALSVLEPLYHNIEPIEERTALHVCLLLLDVALACQECMMPFKELM